MTIDEKNSALLKDTFDQICQSKNVFHGWGPPMALFRTTTYPMDHFVYVSFSNRGIIEKEGSCQLGAATFDLALAGARTTFDEWLQPNRTLAWRTMPEVEQDPDRRWRIHWRCVQLNDDSRSLSIEWNF